jgi:hypothetical protein
LVRLEIPPLQLLTARAVSNKRPAATSGSQAPTASKRSRTSTELAETLNLTPISNNQVFSGPVGFNMPSTTPYALRSTPTTMLRSQFDSPVFNNTPYRQPAANPYFFNTSAAHPPPVHFPPTPQFQAIQSSRPSYLYTPRLGTLEACQSPPSFTNYYPSGSRSYNMDMELDTSPIICIVPSQHRNTIHRDTGGDQNVIESGNMLVGIQIQI